MHLPRLMPTFESLSQRRLMTPHERRETDEKLLKFRTNVCLLIAVLIGVAIAVCHGLHVTVSIAAFAAALGMGGVLGFLFGVPGASHNPVTIGRADTVAVGTGSGSQTTGGDVVPSPGPKPEPKPAPTPEPDADLKPHPAPNPAQLAKPASAPQAQKPAPSPASVPQPSGNTSNLEQVADWVTKLLLGGGLTQMQRIPPKIWQWSRNIAVGIVGDDPRRTEALIAANQAFAAGFIVYGFILGFFAGYLITKLQLGSALSS